VLAHLTPRVRADLWQMQLTAEVLPTQEFIRQVVDERLGHLTLDHTSGPRPTKSKIPAGKQRRV
jgi:hypothetical protein